MKVREAAKIMGVTEQFVRVGLQQGRLPFGVAVKMRRWSYYINETRFYEFIKEDLPYKRVRNNKTDKDIH